MALQVQRTIQTLRKIDNLFSTNLFSRAAPHSKTTLVLHDLDFSAGTLSFADVDHRKSVVIAGLVLVAAAYLACRD